MSISKELIVIEQLPVITERLALLGDEIDRKVLAALSLECSEETKQIVKNERTALSKEFVEFESKRKAVKSAVMNPYEQFEQIYKKHVADKYKAADVQLKSKIDTVEIEQKKKLEDAAKEFFAEYLQSKNIDFITFEQSGIKVGLSDNPTKLRKQCTTFIDRVADDLALIETQECKEEILVEYKAHLNCSNAITTVVSRHKAIQEQKSRQAEREATIAAQRESAAKVEEITRAVSAPLQPLQAPKIEAKPQPPESDPVRRLTFTVEAPISKLKAIKKFLEDGGYKYE